MTFDGKQYKNEPLHILHSAAGSPHGPGQPTGGVVSPPGAWSVHWGRGQSTGGVVSPLGAWSAHWGRGQPTSREMRLTALLLGPEESGWPLGDRANGGSIELL